MLLPFFLLVILVVWALIDGDLYAKEAAIYGGVGLICFVAFLLIPGFGVAGLVVVTLIDIYLLIKLVGNPNAF